MPVKGHSVSSLLRKAAVTLYFVLLLLPAAGFWQGGGRQQAVPGAGRRLGLASNTFLLAALAGLGCMAVGLAAAAWLHNGPLRRKRARWFFLLLAPVPYYVYAWQAACCLVSS